MHDFSLINSLISFGSPTCTSGSYLACRFHFLSPFLCVISSTTTNYSNAGGKGTKTYLCHANVVLLYSVTEMLNSKIKLLKLMTKSKENLNS